MDAFTVGLKVLFLVYRTSLEANDKYHFGRHGAKLGMIEQDTYSLNIEYHTARISVGLIWCLLLRSSLYSVQKEMKKKKVRAPLMGLLPSSYHSLTLLIVFVRTNSPS